MLSITTLVCDVPENGLVGEKLGAQAVDRCSPRADFPLGAQVRMEMPAGPLSAIHLDAADLDDTVAAAVVEARSLG
jgi:hypothetical protein